MEKAALRETAKGFQAAGLGASTLVRRRMLVSTVCLGTVWASGCGGDARVELTAADSIESLAGGLELAVREYHGDTAKGDDLREAAAIAAFVKRIRQAAEDPAEQERHVAEFTAALGRVREDRRVEWSRFTASLDNIETLREITGGLRRLAVESLALRDEARRYVFALIDRQQSSTDAGGEKSNPPPS